MVRSDSVTVSEGRQARGRRMLAGGAAASLLAGGALLAAPAAFAVDASPCAGQSFDEGDGSECTVADGETVYFVVRGGAGGRGGASYEGQLGGYGGFGYQVSGSYTNTSGDVEVIFVDVGSSGESRDPGTAEIPDGQDGGSGTSSDLAVSGGDDIVSAGGGAGGLGGVGSTGTAASGANGILAYPDSLPSGWTGGAGIGLATVVFSSAPSPSPETGSSSSAPAPRMQQFGLPSSGSCDEAAPLSLNWAGVASGGWGQSWAWWVNAGLGGPVCTRTLVYGPSGMWVVS